MNTESLDFIRQLVARRSAIMLDARKGYLVQARLLPLARSLGLPSIDQLVVELRRQPDGPLADQVIDAMTTNETSFFRDTVPFEALRDIILPRLLEGRMSSRRLSIWCAACAMGQEPYSIAMLLREHFRALRDWDIRILASDISATALARAVAGQYGEVEIRRGLPPALRDKYFRCLGTTWWIADEIREMVTFRQINLIGDWPPLPKMDIVLLRNVMVYFETETKRRILSRVRSQLCADGYLFLGGAETTLLLDDAFTRIQNGRYSYYRLGQQTAGSNAAKE
ncbi:MAG: CheR family methyltransferase [Pirellulaceae bacterium]